MLDSQANSKKKSIKKIFWRVGIVCKNPQNIVPKGACDRHLATGGRVVSAALRSVLNQGSVHTRVWAQKIKSGLFQDVPFFQWNPKYGCKGTVTTRFALIALVAWQY